MLINQIRYHILICHRLVQLEEAITFIEDNTRKLLNTERVTIYPVSARTTLEAKLSASKEHQELALADTHWKSNSFDDFEKFLYSFLDGSTSAGMERMKLKLETPVSIAERLLSSCETLVRQDCRYAKQDLVAINDLISSVKDYATKMESESISWRRKALSSVSLLNFCTLYMNIKPISSVFFFGVKIVVNK